MSRDVGRILPMSEARESRRLSRLELAYFTAVLLIMAALLGTAWLSAGFGVSVRQIWSDAWGRLTVVDAYLAIFTVYVLAVWPGERGAARWLWLAVFVAGGSLGIALYFLSRGRSRSLPR